MKDQNQIIAFKALEIARQELVSKVHEIGGDNHGPRVEEYLHAAGATAGDPWCASFVYWCVREACKQLAVDNPLKPVPNHAYVQSYVDTFKKLGLTFLALDQAMPGDLFAVFHPSQGRYAHIGFVDAIETDYSKFMSVEGNSNSTGSREGVEVCSNPRTEGTTMLFIRWTLDL